MKAPAVLSASGGGDAGAAIAGVTHRHGPDLDHARESLGLATDRPIIMSGHQAGLWHPGIAAKLFAVLALAERLNAQPVWLVVDHDDADAVTVRAPARESTTRGPRASSGKLIDRPWLWADRRAGIPAGVRPAAAPAEPDLSGREDFVSDRLLRAHEALDTHAGRASLGEQTFAAACDLLEVAEPATLRSSALFASGAFDAVLAALRDSGPEAAATLAQAARAEPEAGVGALPPNAAPLWRLAPAAARRRVALQDLDKLEREELAPAGVLMTAMLRAVACDLFVHGTGGGGTNGRNGYDAVGERWIEAWGGWPLGAELAPVLVATATLTLPITGADEVADRPAAERELTEAKWRTHAAMHNPGLLGDDDAQAQKLVLVDRIERKRCAGEDSKQDYLELHQLLARTRAVHADSLKGLAGRVAELGDAIRDATLLNDRTWPIAVHPAASLRSLQENIRALVDESLRKETVQ